MQRQIASGRDSRGTIV